MRKFILVGIALALATPWLIVRMTSSEFEQRFEGPAKSGARIEVPQGALRRNVTLWVKPLETPSHPLPRGASALSSMQLGPSVKFRKPVKVTFPLTESIPSDEKLSVAYLGKNGWELTDVEARVTPDGRHAEAWLPHFSDWSILRGVKDVLDKIFNPHAPHPVGDWDPNFIRVLLKTSLVKGFGRTNRALTEILKNMDNGSGPLTPIQLADIYGTSSTPAFELYQKMEAWLRAANPSFIYFLLMVKLARHPGDPEAWSEFLPPIVFHWAKVRFLTPDGQAIADEAFADFMRTKNFWYPLFEPLVALVLAKHTGERDLDVALMSVLSVAATKAQSTTPVLDESAHDIGGGFLYYSSSGRIIHKDVPALAFSYAPRPMDDRNFDNHVQKTTAQLEADLANHLTAWEAGTYGSQVSSLSFHELCAFLKRDLETLKPKLQYFSMDRFFEFLNVVAADLEAKYQRLFQGTLAWSTNASVPFPAAARRVSSESWAIDLPKSPLSALASFELPSDTYLLSLTSPVEGLEIAALCDEYDTVPNPNFFWPSDKKEIGTATSARPVIFTLDKPLVYLQFRWQPGAYRFAREKRTVTFRIERVQKTTAPVWELHSLCAFGQKEVNLLTSMDVPYMDVRDDLEGIYTCRNLNCRNYATPIKWQLHRTAYLGDDLGGRWRILLHLEYIETWKKGETHRLMLDENLSFPKKVRIGEEIVFSGSYRAVASPGGLQELELSGACLGQVLPPPVIASGQEGSFTLRLTPKTSVINGNVHTTYTPTVEGSGITQGMWASYWDTLYREYTNGIPFERLAGAFSCSASLEKGSFEAQRSITCGHHDVPPWSFVGVNFSYGPARH